MTEETAVPTTSPNEALLASAAKQAAAVRPKSLREQRRVRLAHIDYGFAMAILKAGVQWRKGTVPTTGYMNLPEVRPELPADAEIVGVTVLQDRDNFLVLIASSEFDPVPAGLQIPLFSENPEWVTCKVVELNPVEAVDIVDWRAEVRRRLNAFFAVRMEIDFDAANKQIDDLLSEVRKVERLSTLTDGDEKSPPTESEVAIDEITRIAAMPDVLAKKGVGNGTVSEAVTALIGELVQLRSERDAAKTGQKAVVE